MGMGHDDGGLRQDDKQQVVLAGSVVLNNIERKALCNSGGLLLVDLGRGVARPGNNNKGKALIFC